MQFPHSRLLWWRWRWEVTHAFPKQNIPCAESPYRKSGAKVGAKEIRANGLLIAALQIKKSIFIVKFVRVVLLQVDFPDKLSLFLYLGQNDLLLVVLDLLLVVLDLLLVVLDLFSWLIYPWWFLSHLILFFLQFRCSFFNFLVLLDPPGLSAPGVVDRHVSLISSGP